MQMEGSKVLPNVFIIIHVPQKVNNKRKKKGKLQISVGMIILCSSKGVVVVGDTSFVYAGRHQKMDQCPEIRKKHEVGFQNECERREREREMGT